MNVADVRREDVREALNRPRAYHEEIERRREQERRDEALARRLQGLDLDDNLNRRNDFGVFGVGNAGGHFMNEHFVQRATNILAGAYNPMQAAAADRLISEIRGTQRTDDVPRRAIIPPAAVTPQIPNVAAPAMPRPSMVRRNTVTARRTGGGGADADRNTFYRAADYVDERRVTPPINARAGISNDSDTRRHSMLAGLTKRTTVGRVDEWRRHISGGDGAVAR